MDPLIIGLIILSIVTIVLASLVIWMYLKLRKFLIGVDSAHIGESLTHVSNELENLNAFRAITEATVADMEKRLQTSIRSAHTVRFNPFKGTGGGGNQSFATTLLNEKGDGVIISSLYSREYVSVFSKPVASFVSEHGLSDEEATSLEQAKRGLSANN
jgi:hypothetical protein